MQFVFTFQMPPENEALQQQLARARCLLFHDKKKIMMATSTRSNVSKQEINSL